MEQNPRAVEGARGSVVRLGSELQNSTSRSAISQRSLADEVRAFRPWESDTTITLRCRLNRAAVGAAARATNANSPHGRQCFWLANQIATTWLWARAKDDELSDVLRGINRLITSADAFERNGSGL